MSGTHTHAKRVAANDVSEREVESLAYRNFVNGLCLSLFIKDGNEGERKQAAAATTTASLNNTNTAIHTDIILLTQLFAGI